MTGVSPTGSSGTGGTSSSSSTPPGEEQTISPDSSGTISPSGITPPPPDPSSVPGSGRSPPSTWQVDDNGTVTIAVAGSNLVVTADGVSSQRALGDVTMLTVSSSGIDFDLSGGAITVPITYDGGGAGSITVGPGPGSSWSYDTGAGRVSGGGISSLTYTGVDALNAGGASDTLDGPAANSVWMVSGPGSGTVGGATFSGFEYLVGAPNNDDQFVFGPAGSVSGYIDGGAGGYDTLVLDGGNYTDLTYTATGQNSGSVSRDGNVINYLGLEPITVDPATSGADQTFTAPDTLGETITIADDGIPGNGTFTVGSTDSEGVEIENAAALSTLTINAGSGGDTVDYESIDSEFTGNIVVNGGAGSDTITAGNSNGGTWEITGIDAGTYTPTGGPTISFNGVENLNGGPGDDEFDFDTTGGITGSLTSGTGNLGISLAGLIHLSGTGGFSAYSNVGDKLSDGSTVTGLTVFATDLSSASVFVGVGYGTPEAVGTTVEVPDATFALVSDPTGGRAWVTASVTDPGVASLDFNSAAGDGTAVDFTKLDLNNDGTYGGTGDTLTAGTTTFSDTGANVNATLTNPSFDLAGLATGQASQISVGAQVVNADIDGNGTVDPSTGDVQNGDLVTFTATSPQLTVGSGSAGITASAASATISLLLPETPIGPATDTRYWLGVDLTGLSGSLSIGTAADATVSSVTALVNEAGGVLTPSVGSPIAATALDWSTALGTSTPTALATVTGAQAQVTGDLDSLSVGDGLLTGSAGFSVASSDVTVDDGGSVDSTLYR